MLKELERHVLAPWNKEPLAQVLRRAPWCWPKDASGPAWSRAVEVAGTLPSLQPGQAPLLTSSECATTLWLLHPYGGLPAAHASAAVLGMVPRGEWHEAAAALPRVLPVLWTSVAEARDSEVCAYEVVSRGHLGHHVDRYPVLHGRSFGLAFLLALASRVLGLPLRADVVASAEIDPMGGVHRVDGIAEKVRLILATAPRLSMLLVAPANASEAERAARGSELQIVPVETAADALEVAFDGDLAQHLVDVGGQPARRDELVQSMFRLALGGRTHMVDWTPVEQAANLALQRWRKVKPDQRRRLQFVAAVAACNERNEGSLRLPSKKWLHDLPLPTRIQVLANFAELSSETGSPSARSVEKAARPYLVETHEAFLPHLALRAALGRLASVNDDLSLASRLLWEAASGFFARECFAEALPPLADLYRLAAIHPDVAGFERAECLREEIERCICIEAVDDGALTLQRTRAAWELRVIGADEAERCFAALADDHNRRAQIRFSATRWQVRCLEVQGNSDVACTFVEGIRLVGQGREAEVARTFVALVDLDRGLADGQGESVAAAIEALAKEEAGWVERARRGRRKNELGAYIARAYPD